MRSICSKRGGLRTISVKISCVIAALTVLAVTPDASYPGAPFYEGKTVTIVVGSSPGGGFDAYSRLIARHMSRHIPGNPTIVVQNMPGAGSLIAANHVYKVARPDGLTIGHFLGGLFMQQLLGRPGVEFDARKFEYLGVPTQDNRVIGVSKASGVTSVEQWIASKTTVKFGGVGPGAATDDIPNVLKAALGLPIQLVSGYKGSADIRLAFNSGEVQGICEAWESLKATWRAELESGDLIIILQNTPKPLSDLAKVPLDINLAKTDEAKKLIQVAAHSVGQTYRPYVLPPHTPRDQAQIMRKAFLDTFRDAAFLAEAKKAQLDINPLSGEELAQNVNRVLNLEPALVARLREILK